MVALCARRHTSLPKATSCAKHASFARQGKHHCIKHAEACFFLEKVDRFDRISRRGVHLSFREVQPWSKGIHFQKGVQSERLDCPSELGLSHIGNLLIYAFT